MATTTTPIEDSCTEENELRDWILSAIDKLRERKARPDVDRISALVHRYHAVSKSVTSKHLEELVDYGAVIRVEYKGSVSYRNALKWKRSCLSGSVLNSHATSTRFLECLKRLEIRKGSALAEVGFTVEDIEAELAEMRSEVGANGLSESAHDSEFRGTGLIQALDRESATGGLVRLPGPRYALDEDGSKKKMLNMKRNAKFMDMGMPPRRGRPPGSKTKKKLLPAPIVNKKIKIDPVIPSMLARQICRICASADAPENMLRCRDCGLTAHVTCLNYTSSVLDKLSEGQWQCARCKTCAVCLNNSSFGKVFVCKMCDRGYHMQCHRPHMMTNHPNWTCANCSEAVRREEEEAAIKREQQDEELPSENQTPPEPDTSEPTQSNDLSDDVRTWSVNDVHDWLVREGFSREAQAFKEQEIDGACLLLMKRMDVLTGLGIKLGPAVKIHSRILRFQESSI